MIIKSILGGAGLVFTIGWFVWVIVPQESCERIERSGSLVSGIGNVLRDALAPRVSDDTKLDMIRWSLQAEISFKGFVANQFFNRLDCSKWHGKDRFETRMLELLEESAGDEAVQDESKKPEKQVQESRQ